MIRIIYSIIELAAVPVLTCRATCRVAKVHSEGLNREKGSKQNYIEYLGVMGK